MITSAPARRGPFKHARMPSKRAPERALNRTVLIVGLISHAGRLTMVVANCGICSVAFAGDAAAVTSAPASLSIPIFIHLHVLPILIVIPELNHRAPRSQPRR